MDVDDATHDGLMEIVKQQGDIVLPPNTFQELFWKQQKEATAKSDSQGMCWHPLMIRWYLYIHHRSSGAYQVSNCCLLVYTLGFIVNVSVARQLENLVS